MIRKILLTLIMIGMISFIPLFSVNASMTVTFDDIEWYSTQGINDDWALYTDYITVPLNSFELEFTVPNTIYVEQSNDDYNSAIEFNFKGTSTPVIIELADANPNIYGYTYLDLDAVSVLNNLDLKDMLNFRILVAQAFSSVSSGYIDTWETDFTLSINLIPRFVFFYSQLSLYTQIAYYDTFNLPTEPTAPSGYDFIGWRTINGTIFDINNINPNDYDENGYLYLYATFVNLHGETYTPTNPTDNTPTQLVTLLTALGLYNDAGFMIIYIILMLIIIFGMLAMGLTSIPIMIATLIATIFFIYLGWLPIFAIILIMMIYMIGMLIMFKGGIQSE